MVQFDRNSCGEIYFHSVAESTGDRKYCELGHKHELQALAWPAG